MITCPRQSPPPINATALYGQATRQAGCLVGVAAFHVFLVAARKSKVGNLELAFVAYEEVGALDVPVKDAFVVAMAHALQRPPSRGLGGQDRAAGWRCLPAETSISCFIKVRICSSSRLARSDSRRPAMSCSMYSNTYTARQTSVGSSFPQPWWRREGRKEEGPCAVLWPYQVESSGLLAQELIVVFHIGYNANQVDNGLVLQLPQDLDFAQRRDGEACIAWR